MSGNASNADGDVPDLDDREAEGENESTIAMEAPAFEIPSNVPLPITSPPPAPDAPDPPTRLVPSPSRDLLEKDEPLPKPSPMAPTSFDEEQPEVATIALPKGVVDSVRKQNEEEPEEEPTRAVGRDELLRPRDERVVIGDDDAVGDEATVAVAAGANAAAAVPAGIAQALMETLGQGPGAPAPEPVFPPPPPPRPGTAGAIGAPSQPRPHQPTALGMAPPAVTAPAPWTPQGPPPSQSMPASMPGSFAQPAVSPQRISNPGVPPYSSGSMPAAVPQSAPFQATMPLMNAPPNPPMTPQPPMGMGPIPWQPGPPEPKRSPLAALFGGRPSGQMILLVVVGTICLAIFITGIVLFFTTKT